MLKKLNLSHSEVLVDIGAGTGFFSIQFQKYLDGGKIFACDVSDIMISWMLDNVAGFYPGIIPTKINGSKLPLSDGVADLVFMINVHHELDNVEGIFKEIDCVLKVGGKVCIVDWKNEEMVEGPPQHIRCHPEDIRDQLVKGGFQNIHIDQEMAQHYLIIAEKTV